MQNGMSNIKHVVYYMLENRSFDNVLGWLYDADNPPANIIADPEKKQIAFMGLEENTYFNQFSGDDTKHYVQKGTESMAVPSPDPQESYQNVCFELYNKAGNPTAGAPATMDGFLQDYSTAYQSLIWGTLQESLEEMLDMKDAAQTPGTGGGDLKKKTITKEEALQIMQTYSPEQLPVLNGLAKNFAVSDEWFSSVPSQTNCNRAFSVCGTSCGLVNNEGSYYGLRPSAFKTSKSIWKVLSDNGFNTTDDWMVFYQALTLSDTYCYTQEAFDVPNGNDNVANITEFFDRAAAGNLPKFSYLEPNFIGVNMNPSDTSGALDVELGETNGNSYHPPAQLGPGEVFLKKLYDSMTSTPAAKAAWENTLLIITFDEHGGTYDHVPPPWGAAPPWGNTKPDFELEAGFGFDRFGIRVPTIMASPWIDSGTVFRSLTDVPYDHTSMIATVLEWFGVPREKWELGERVANAPTFDNVLTRTEARADVPEVNVSAETAKEDSASAPIMDLHYLLVPKAAVKLLEGKLDAKTVVEATMDILDNSGNVGLLESTLKNWVKEHI